ncbi:AAA family ATPase [Leeia sp.]|uniref:AAA family ATPase n=1 Tax=Leeia sp. TaxID=2884678 RepID=UPI0035AF47C5
MKFHLKKIGIIDKADLELSNLTIICGENNTGKTYITYAIYGFLALWRDIVSDTLRDDVQKLLEKENFTQIDLSEIFKNGINTHLEELGKRYQHKLQRVFSKETTSQDSATFAPSTEIETKLIEIKFESSIYHASNGDVYAKVKKDAGSVKVDVFTVDPDAIKSPNRFLVGFISETIAHAVLSQHLPPVHISSAERTGAALFRSELDLARTRILKAIAETDARELQRNPYKLIKQVTSKYALPVEDNVDFVREIENISKNKSELSQKHPDILEAFEGIVGGEYKVVRNQLVFLPKGLTKSQRFTMGEASSSVRALLDIGYYLRCEAKIGDLLIIDEPELNLHPKSQRAFARLLARLVNAGIKVLITTHSDYIVKELNTLIMLNQKTPHTKSIQNQYHYDDKELLNPENTRLYITCDSPKSPPGPGRPAKTPSTWKTLKKAAINSSVGIEVDTFDSTIDVMNEIQSHILYGEEF